MVPFMWISDNYNASGGEKKYSYSADKLMWLLTYPVLLI